MLKNLNNIIPIIILSKTVMGTRCCTEIIQENDNFQVNLTIKIGLWNT